jgi:hypothetical protein
MIERIARIIAKGHGVTDENVDRQWRNYRSDAREVLEALRGSLPKEMVWAGAWCQEHCSDVDQIFAQMIYGALYPEDVQPHRLYLDNPA